ncbi:EAL domain-containing protein [Emcibacter nanhaiensis]|uniref:EAL domain-containing protein n=1 Tax=Emcibacter nanhaiensis TaxID=1505037 RepID=A0A501PHS3_9PROT|nr:EAL domain-containing protein [Emcibacter nanhaiensis]TPD60023.1 EAL domain-containing protein [Emcibacter nanhaiensis]
MTHEPTSQSVQGPSQTQLHREEGNGLDAQAKSGCDPLIKVAIETSTDGIAILDYRRELEVVEANQAFLQMLQLDYEEVLGLHPWDWDAEASKDEILERSHELSYRGGGQGFMETSWRRKDGSLLPVQVSVAAFSLHGLGYVYVICKEKNGIDGIESNSEIGEELQTIGFENSRDGMVVISLENLKVVKANTALARMLGRDPSKLVGAWLSDWDTRYFQEIFANNQKHDGEATFAPVYLTQLKRADGGVVEAEVSALCFTLSGQLYLNFVYRDIGWRKNLERRLDETNQRFRTYFDATQRFMSIYTPEGKRVSADSISSTPAGSGSDVKGDPILWEESCWIDDDDRKRVKRRFREAVAGESIFFEIDQCDAQGEIRTKEVYFEPIEDENGTVILVLARSYDISGLKQTQSALREANDLANITISSMTEGLIRTDIEGVIRLCNKAAANIIGTDVKNIIGKKAGSILSVFDRATGRQMANPVDEALKGRPTIDIHRFVNIKGVGDNSSIVTLSCVRLPGGEAGPAGAILVLRDAAEQVALMEHLSWLATHDEQTALLNRRGFSEQIDVARRTITDKNPAFLLLIDLDQFKVINDSCGRDAGDKMLENIVWVLMTSIRDGDIIGRIGSDEFAVLLHDLSLDKARAVAERLVGAIEEYRFLYNARVYSVTASAGMTVLDRPEVQSEEFMSEVVAACEIAQQEGRGHIHVFRFDDSSIVEARQSVDWLNQIQEGLSEHSFELFLQRVVSPELRTLGYEALIRMPKEDGGVIAPGVFMPAARRFGMITKINEEVVTKAIELVSDDSFPSDGRYLAINIGAASLCDHLFREWFLERLSENPKAAKRLMVEITETDEVHWSPEEIEFIEQIRSLDVPVYLDDFGTGYNSFDLLKTLTVDGIKIERSLVADILSSPVDQAVVSAACSIAESLDINLVVEGVETEEVFGELKRLGVPRFQGYLFHKPEAAEMALREDLEI